MKPCHPLPLMKTDRKALRPREVATLRAPRPLWLSRGQLRPERAAHRPSTCPSRSRARGADSPAGAWEAGAGRPRGFALQIFHTYPGDSLACTKGPTTQLAPRARRPAPAAGSAGPLLLPPHLPFHSRFPLIMYVFKQVVESCRRTSESFAAQTGHCIRALVPWERRADTVLHQARLSEPHGVGDPTQPYPGTTAGCPRGRGSCLAT